MTQRALPASDCRSLSSNWTSPAALFTQQAEGEAIWCVQLLKNPYSVLITLHVVSSDMDKWRPVGGVASLQCMCVRMLSVDSWKSPPAFENRDLPRHFGIYFIHSRNHGRRKCKISLPVCIWALLDVFALPKLLRLVSQIPNAFKSSAM